jgi:thiol-disulfide isomerase/thioredoxin
VSRRTSLTLAAVSVAGLLAASGCAGSSATQPVAQTAAQPATQTAATTGGAAAVPASLTFTGKTLEGAPFDAAVMAGKPALLWFWAPWCATCAQQAASIGDLDKEYGNRLAILGIAGLDDSEQAMQEFVNDLDVGAVPHLDDRTGELWKRFKVVQQSSFVLIDRKGSVVHTGWMDDVDLRARVKTLAG